MRRVQMYLAEHQYEALNRLAGQRGLSTAEIARQAIDLGLVELEQEAEFTRRAAALRAADDLRERIARRWGRTIEINVAEDLNRVREDRLDQLTRSH